MFIQARRQLVSMPRRQKMMLMLAADFLALTAFMQFAAMQGHAPDTQAPAWATPALLAVTALPLLSACGLYGQLVRFIDSRFLRAALLGTAALGAQAWAAASVLQLPGAPPASTIPAVLLTAFCYLVLSRFGAGRFLRHAGRRRPRVAIYGAGQAGFQLMATMRASGVYLPVLFVDDNPELHKRHMAGLRIVSAARLLALREALGIEQVVLAMPSAPASRHREIYRLLRANAVPVRTLPTLAELVNAQVSPQSVREISLEDLLGRRPIAPRQDLFARCVTDKHVLVTGAGGSIGSELCRQVAGLEPRVLVLLDHSEYALYEIERELRAQQPDLQIVAVLGSVCTEALVQAVMQRHRIDTVYHAAAYKHVPMVETNIAQGIRNNVWGSWLVARCAARLGVTTCVLVSTDKAVRPTNVMGATKRASELVFQALAQEPGTLTKFSMVRFGNVLGSSGSVVPLFREQLRRGGPLTVTHPEITRYFMLIPEAAQLVIQAGAMARGGEVFVLDMGEPVRVMDLARTLIQLSGMTERSSHNPDGDVEIRVTGLRQGEKLYEELLIGEHATHSEHPRILCSREHALPMPELQVRLRALLAACEEPASVQAMLQALQDMVDEFSPYSPWAARAPREASPAPRAVLPAGMASALLNNAKAAS